MENNANIMTEQENCGAVSIIHIYIVSPLSDFFLFLQHGLYAFMKNSVSSFRDFVGAPDTPKWNSVLFGGNNNTTLTIAYM